MKTVYRITFAEGNSNFSRAIETYDTIEEARKALADYLESYAERYNYQYFATPERAKEEIEYIRQDCKTGKCDWSKQRVCEYIDALRAGIKTKAPFAVQSECADMISCEYDSFGFDGDHYNIESEEVFESLQDLADYINEYAKRNPEDAWDHKTVDKAIADNDWTPAEEWETRDVCDDGERKITINDNGDAVVVDID